MANCFNKYKLLLWKNSLLQRRNKLSLSIQLLIPLVLWLLMVLLRFAYVNPQKLPEKNFQKQPLDQLPAIRELSQKTNLTLFYSPKNALLEKIVKETVTQLNLDGFKGYRNAAAMEKALLNGRHLCGVQFNDKWSKLNKSLPKHMSFVLRFPSELRTDEGEYWDTHYLFPIIQSPEPRSAQENTGATPNYMKEGFLPIQHALSMAYIKEVKGQILPEIQLQRFPYRTRYIDHLLIFSRYLLYIILIIMYEIPSMFLIQSIVHEKENQLKEFMKIIGVDNDIQWLAWFTWGMVLFLIPNIIFLLILTIPLMGGSALFPQTDWTLLFFYTLMYSFSCICFSFLCSALFTKGLPAQLFCTLFFTLSLIIFFLYILGNYDKLSYESKLWIIVSFINAACIGFYILASYELYNEGLQWDNIFQPFSVNDNLTMGHILLSLLVNGIIFWLLSLYLEQVFPGKYGTPRKWYFLFTKNFWSKESSPTDNVEESMMPASKSDAFEKEPSDKTSLVKVKNLRKSYKDHMVVNGISLNLYEGEITVLLGHNGAGKTTTIYMLTGLIPPTSGVVIINGYDIRTNKDIARNSLGLCLQEDVLFDELTVQNHLEFYCVLKGLSGEGLKKEIEKYLSLFDMELYKDTRSKKLSGGWKRKLCVCCALCGGSKVVILDEPSSGVDPTSRRDLWNVLQKEKSGRSILLTTHFMDEADLLGDRIAIMAFGEIKCYGTSFFLKKKFGTGYRLVCVKLPDCDPTRVTELLRKYIPNIEPTSDIGFELSYSLPDKSSNVFEAALKDLENNSDNVKISGFGIEISSLQDVFMKVGAEHMAKYSLDVEKFIEANKQVITGRRLLQNRLGALFLKRALHVWYNPILFVLQILVPCLLILYTQDDSFKTQKAMAISLTQYKTATVIMEKGHDVEKYSLPYNISTNYMKIVKSYGPKYKIVTIGNKETFQDYILKFDNKMKLVIDLQYVAAATIGKDHLVAWLNSQPLHTAPLTINLLHNALLKSVTDNSYEIKVTNHPLPYRVETLQKTEYKEKYKFGELIHGFNLAGALFILFPMNERVKGSKLQQLIAGIRLSYFWLISFLWDMLTFILAVIFVLIVLLSYREENVTNNIHGFVVLILMFGVCNIIFIYVLAFALKKPFHGLLLVYILGVVGLVTALITEELLDEKSPVRTAIIIFTFPLPIKHLNNGLNRIDHYIGEKQLCKNPDLNQLPQQIKCELFPKCCKTLSSFSWERPGILKDIISLLILAIIYTLLLYLIERRKALFPQIFRRNQNRYLSTSRDADVIREQEKIANMSLEEQKNQRVVLDKLTKKYRSFLAVKSVSLCVQAKECFGLLGVNGAGKTSTFKMMTGDINITAGKAYICGFILPKEMSKIYRKIGYCPQFEGFLEEFTGKQTLLIFCLIRGIPGESIKYLTRELSKSLDFEKHLKKRIKNYSGGTKRKLSSALAVLGLPSVIFLDEPTTGMDPASKRASWDLFSLVRDAGSSIVLCSHSMDECEALCTRVTIMVKGELKCLGSIQHLKNKFATGLTLKVRLKSSDQSDARPSVSSADKSTLQNDIVNLQTAVFNGYPNATLLETYENIATFYIPLTDVKWSEMFGFMETKRQLLNVEDYAIQQESLEDIFLQLSTDTQRYTQVPK